MADPISVKYRYASQGDAVRNKDWAAGSSKQLTVPEFVIDDGVSQVSKTYAPSWQKVVDEPIVNVLDVLIKGIVSKGVCPTEMWVDFEPSGLIRISNNGPGIDVAIHPVLSEMRGRNVYVVSYIFEDLHQGSNTKPDPTSIVGGTNGIGVKICNFFSSKFRVETYDYERKKHFTQTWTGGTEATTGPIVTNYKPKMFVDPNVTRIANHNRGYTIVEFQPDYKLFGYPESTLDADTYASLVDIVRTRTYLAAFYGISTTNKWTTFFNSMPIPVPAASYIPKAMFPNSDVPVFRCMVQPPDMHPWDCIVAIGADLPKVPSIVNGIVVQGGPHVAHITQQIVDAVSVVIRKALQGKKFKFDPILINKHIRVFIIAKIPAPGWTGQRKDKVKVPESKILPYKLDDKFIKSVVKVLEARVLESILDIPAAPQKSKEKFAYDKYKPAGFAGTKKPADLIVCEGDSTMNTICDAVVATVGRDRCGVICTGGVIMNARREVIVKGKARLCSDKLRDNEFFKAFFQCTGLNTAYKYDPNSPTYAAEIAKLRYKGSIVICVDQDHDGTGLIAGLLMNAIHVFWPKLIVSGYIKLFRTVLIRAYPKTKGKVLEFYNEQSFKDAAVDSRKYDIRYFKGIGGHSPEEMVHMFRKFDQNLVTMYLDEESDKLFEIYFGEDSNLRKVELAASYKPAARELIEEQLRTLRISCSDHLRHPTREYQDDNLSRKLTHAISGQNQASNKILDGILKAYSSNTATMKVDELAAFISETTHYHHGLASLDKSVTGRGFIAVGGKQIPILVPVSYFGSRVCGGKKASSPRYISARINRAIRLVYPEKFYQLLRFNFDEGKRSDPEYFIPIIPMAVLESVNIPAHGWKLDVWARDMFYVLDVVRRMILDETSRVGALPVCVYKSSSFAWRGGFTTYKGTLYSTGQYSISETIVRGVKHYTVVVTELPLRIWTDEYLEDINKLVAADDSLIDDVDPKLCSATRVHIVVTLKPGAYEKICAAYGNAYFDPIEDYLKLRNAMHNELNMMMPDYSVREFSSYEEIIKTWFPECQRMYQAWIERELLRIEFDIQCHKNIVRYLCDKDVQVRELDEDAQDQVLSELEYDRIDRARINNPGFVTAAELRDVVFGESADYSYLLNLSDRSKSTTSIARYNAHLEALIAELDEFRIKSGKGRFVGAEYWLDDLDELRASLQKGVATDWGYEIKDKYVYV